jgi:hypothetical protein
MEDFTKAMRDFAGLVLIGAGLYYATFYLILTF